MIIKPIETTIIIVPPHNIDDNTHVPKMYRRIECKTVAKSPKLYRILNRLFINCVNKMGRVWKSAA